MLTIDLEEPDDGSHVETLLDLAFGQDRWHKISYRYRAGIAPVADLCLVARDERTTLVGAIRYWPIRLAAHPALLLGPLAIHPGRQGQGIGRRLLALSLERAARAGWRLVFLVGDVAYYRERGFHPVPAAVLMPDEDPARLHHLVLGGGILPAEGGTMLRADGSAAIEPARAHESRDGHAARGRVARVVVDPGPAMAREESSRVATGRVLAGGGRCKLG